MKASSILLVLLLVPASACFFNKPNAALANAQLQIEQCAAKGTEIGQRMEAETAAPSVDVSGIWRCTVENHYGETWQMAQSGADVSIMTRGADGTTGSMNGRIGADVLRMSDPGAELKIGQSGTLEGQLFDVSAECGRRVMCNKLQ